MLTRWRQMEQLLRHSLWKITKCGCWWIVEDIKEEENTVFSFQIFLLRHFIKCIKYLKIRIVFPFIYNESFICKDTGFKTSSFRDHMKTFFYNSYTHTHFYTYMTNKP